MLWSSNAAAQSNAPLFTGVSNFPGWGTGAGTANGANNRLNLFANITPSAIINNMIVATYGVPNTALAKAETLGRHDVVSPGWYLHKEGMGPVINLTITAGGSGTSAKTSSPNYANTDLLQITSAYAVGGSNTTATIQTNTNGVITSLGGLSNGGGMFTNYANTTLTVTNAVGGASNGSGATFTYSLGGRAGRVQNECLVAYGTLTTNTLYSPAAFPTS